MDKISEFFGGQQHWNWIITMRPNSELGGIVKADLDVEGLIGGKEYIWAGVEAFFDSYENFYEEIWDYSGKIVEALEAEKKRRDETVEKL